MLYRIAHYLRANLSIIWESVEFVNSLLFRMIYDQRIKGIVSKLEQLTSSVNVDNNYTLYPLQIRLLSERDVDDLFSFFSRQPKDDFKFFQPHSFDRRTLLRLVRRTSFISMAIFSNNQIIGYFFLRSFVHGRCFLGKMVDKSWRGKGIGKIICTTAMEIATLLGLRMFESINKENLASLRSSSVLKQVVVKELKDGDLLLEDFPMDN